MNDTPALLMKFKLPDAEVKPILALGAESESSIALAANGELRLYGPFGDLRKPDSLERYLNAIASLQTELDAATEISVFDMHPDYISTRRAAEFASVKRLPVQHHHAHAAACMFENGLRERSIAVVFDGMGFGGDGGAWGGEFLLCDFLGYERPGHLKSYPMPGGDAATLRPERMAFACLAAEYGTEYPGIDELLPALSRNELTMMRQMLEKKINSPETSSAGRLFDVVAALTGFRGEVEYGAQAAIELERSAAPRAEGRYTYDISDDILSFAGMFEEIRSDIENHVAKPLIAFKFHDALASGAVDMCERIRAKANVNDVALSGGVFNNELLTRLMVQGLKKKKFNVFIHEKTPPGDANIALGQAVIAYNREDVCV
ncbi:MAG: hypothetical protein GXP32_06175 [Kiritimatiellaeota bacterium]|nr:hypothetical protein [Kiritimatiellota bacterium]